MSLTKYEKDALIERLKSSGWNGRKLESVLPYALSLLESGNSIDHVLRIVFEEFGYLLQVVRQRILSRRVHESADASLYSIFL